MINLSDARMHGIACCRNCDVKVIGVLKWLQIGFPTNAELSLERSLTDTCDGYVMTPRTLMLARYETSGPGTQ